MQNLKPLNSGRAGWILKIRFKMIKFQYFFDSVMACNAVWLPDGPACRWVLKRLFRGFSVAVNIAGPADKPDVGTSLSKHRKHPGWKIDFHKMDSPVNKLYMGEREVTNFSIELALNN